MVSLPQEMELAAARILGEWAMMLVEPDSKATATEIFETNEPFFVASLSFKGLISGRYVVLCKRPFANLLAQNLLCTDENSNDEELLDALKEMVNVFGGNLLTSTYGTSEVFALTSPQASMLSTEEVLPLTTWKTIWLKGDGEPVGIAFIPEGIRA